MRSPPPKCGPDRASCGDDGEAPTTRGTATRVERLDGDAERAWAHAAGGLLDAARARLDALNVFPVADSDTGTNVLLTVAQGAEEADAVAPGATAREVARAFARGALVGARGNSGVILSQLLHGFAGALGDDD